MSGEREDKVREEVRSRYEQIAGSGRGCCVGEICCSSAGPDPLASLRLGYGLEDLRAAPVGSDMGLGCGNPQAIANLKQGEVVLDLGSG
ncbi:arsenite methyltransferase, partial [bacterium]|nr:arsenite methyltransferase [bacterium]